MIRPELTNNGMFVVNSQIIEVVYDLGLNVLDYDPGTGRHNFAVFFLFFSFLNER